MKLVCYIKEGHEQLGILVNDILYDTDAVHPELPSSMSMFLNYWEDYFPVANAINESIKQGKISLNQGVPISSLTLISPVPLPVSCREVMATYNYSIEQRPTVTSFPYPLIQFINHYNVQGAGEVNCMPDHFGKLDFEMGVAMVVSTHARNITAEEAQQYIGGFMIMNGIRSRNMQKGKEVTSVLGPWLVTADELEPFRITGNDEHKGVRYNLTMKCSVNGEQLYEGNLADMQWTFAEILESCAYGTYIQPGDVIGTGAIGLGSLLNINTSAQQNEPDYKERWLQKGDVVSIEVNGLGASVCTIVAEDNDLTLMHR